MCASGAASITVGYAASGTYNAGNTFSAQLSNASGSFSSPTALTTTATGTNSLTVSIPAGTASGTGYKVRVVASDPATTGAANTTAFAIVSNPTVSIAPTAAQSIATGVNGTALTATEAPAASSRQWVSAPTSGGPYTNLGVTTTTYTPNFTTPGTYYVAVQSTFAACGTVTSNEVVVTVTTPTLTVSPTSLGGFAAVAGTPSAAQSYTLTGANLVSAVTVTAPTGYAVSLDNATFAASRSVSVADATAGKTVYVRLTGAAAGSFGGNVTNTSTYGSASASASVAVSGTVAPAPVLSTSPTSLPAFNTLAGAASAAQTYRLSGSNLTASVTITAPAGFEVAQDGATYAGTQTVAPDNTGSVTATISVRLAAAAAAGTYSGSISNASAGTATQSVAASGRVVAKPTGTPAISAAPGSSSSVTLGLTAASDGTNLLVVVRPAGSPATAPTDQATYAANATYGAGAPLGQGFVVFAAANASSVTVAGLSASTSYLADVYTYNVGTASGFESYGANSGSTSFATPASLPATVGQLVLEEDFDYPSGTVLSSGTGGNWSRIAGVSTNPIDVDAASLSFAQYGSPARVGGGVTITDGEDVNRAFSVPGSTTDLFVAALVRVNTSATDYFFSLTPGAGSTAYIARLYTKTVTGGYVFGTGYSNTSTASAVYSNLVCTTGTTYLVVLHFIKNPGAADDQVELYVLDPASGVPLSMPTSKVVANAFNAGTTPSEYTPGAVALRQATTTQSIVVDGIRVGTGWGTVVGRPVFTTAGATIAPGYYYDAEINNGDAVAATGAIDIESRLTLTSGTLTTTATNLLTLASGATVAGGSGGSYVNGPLRRAVDAVSGPAASVAFPIGKGGNYRPLTLNISAQTGTTYYQAEQNETDSGTSFAPGSPLQRVNRNRYFTVAPYASAAATTITQPSNFAGTITLSFGYTDKVSDPAATTLVVAKRDNSTQPWASTGTSTANTQTATSPGPAGTFASGTVTSASFTSFSDFTLGSTSPDASVNPLPVQLTSFTATRSSAGPVALAWATASEVNSLRFEVERSLDGRAFSKVAEVAAQGSSAQGRRYASRDAAAPSHPLYYRLRLVDQDGSSRYSATVAVAGPGSHALAYPNPATDQLTVPGAAGQPVTLLDVLGRPVRQLTLGSDEQLGLGDLPAGLYLLQVPGQPAQRITKR